MLGFLQFSAKNRKLLGQQLTMSMSVTYPWAVGICGGQRKQIWKHWAIPLSPWGRGVKCETAVFYLPRRKSSQIQPVLLDCHLPRRPPERCAFHCHPRLPSLWTKGLKSWEEGSISKRCQHQCAPCVDAHSTPSRAINWIKMKAF